MHRLLNVLRPVSHWAQRIFNGKAASRSVCCIFRCGSAALPGKLQPENSRYVLDLLDWPLAAAAQPSSRPWLPPCPQGRHQSGGDPVYGHTEYLAEACATDRVVMMLAGDGRGTATCSCTGHDPPALRDVAAAITGQALEETPHILHADMARKYGIAASPHTDCRASIRMRARGPSGREEIEIIEPVRPLAGKDDTDRAVAGRYPVYPADPARRDCVPAYHDQGWGPSRPYATLGKGINVTLGLPGDSYLGRSWHCTGTGWYRQWRIPAACSRAVDQAIRMVKAGLEAHINISRKRFARISLSIMSLPASCRAIAPAAGDVLVEIGPGLGALTEPLLDHLNHLHVVEIDRDIARLRKPIRLPKHQEGDALAFDFGSLGQNLRIVGNLP